MSVLFYPQENRVFLNEHHNRWYSTSSYYLSKSLLEVPPIIITGVMFSALTYFGTGQVNNFYRFSLYTLNIVSIPDHSFDNFNKYNLFQILSMFVSSSIGSLIGIIIDKQLFIAVGAATTSSLINCLLSGFFVPLKIQDQFIQALSYLSINRLNFESSLIIIYGMDRCEEPLTSFVLKQMVLDDSDLAKNLFLCLCIIIFNL